MKVSVIAEDLTVYLDGRPIRLDRLDLPEEVWAIQYDGSTAEVEYRDGRMNQLVTGQDARDMLDPLIAAAQAQAAREEAEAEAEREAWLDSWERVRQERNVLIMSVRWLLERHQDEQLLGMPTTLSEDDIQELGRYIQALRDVPLQEEQGVRARDVTWPDPPHFVTI